MIFDQYSRYHACADVLRHAGYKDGSQILEVGSGPECLFGRFVNEQDVTYIDPLVSSQSDGRHICGDVFSKNLDNRQFSFVTAVDVYEQWPKCKTAGAAFGRFSSGRVLHHVLQRILGDRHRDLRSRAQRQDRDRDALFDLPPHGRYRCLGESEAAFLRGGSDNTRHECGNSEALHQ